MHVIVSVKQVPDAADVRFDPITNNLIREGVPSIVNPPCLNAAEEALRLKEKYGAYVTAISMGPLQALEAVREVIAMGVDEGILVSDRDMAGADTLATSYTLWKAVRKAAERKAFDLILFGKVAIDGETGQVPTGVAIRLGIPIVSYATRIEHLDLEKKEMVVRRRFDDGLEVVKASLPAALTITEEANKPRKWTLDSILRAKKMNIPIWDKNTIEADPKLLGLKGSPTFVKKIFPPPPRKSGERIDGTDNPKAAASWLVDKLLKTGALGGKKPEERRPTEAEAIPSARGEAEAEVEPTPRYGEVWVFIEQTNGTAADVSWELLGEGSRLAKVYGSKLAGVLLGHNISKLTDEAVTYGAEKVYTVDDPVLERYRTQPYSTALAELSWRYSPEVVLIGATLRGRDLAGPVATVLETGLTADCTALDVEKETGTFVGTRPTFGGNLMAQIICPKHRPSMATVRPRVMKPLKPDPSRRGEIIHEKVKFSERDLQTESLEFIPLDKVGLRLEDAEIIVAGGRGLGSAKNFYLLEELARALGAEVGASRAAVRAGWAPFERQVGQTGLTVRPRLYVAIGISGAIQHIVGIMSADTITAINNDPSASIFKMADYGIVGDLFRVVPALLDELRERGLARK